MPVYEYSCVECGNFEQRQNITEEPLTSCPICGKEVNRVFQVIAAHYKGSGFFSTDNKPDTRVRSASGQLAHRVSEIDEGNIVDASSTRTDAKGRPHITPTRPKSLDT